MRQRKRRLPAAASTVAAAIFTAADTGVTAGALAPQARWLGSRLAASALAAGVSAAAGAPLPWLTFSAAATTVAAGAPRKRRDAAPGAAAAAPASSASSAAAAPRAAAAGKEAEAPWAHARRLKAEADSNMAQGNVAAAAEGYYERSMLLRKFNPAADPPGDHPLLEKRDEGFFRVGRMKLRHDAEQLEYLISLGRLPERLYGQLARLYRNMISSLPRDLHGVDLQPLNKLFDRGYNRALHVTRPDRLPGRALGAGMTGAGAQDFERRFRDSELPPETGGCDAQNGVAYADNFLSEAALEALYQWCLESTMWYGLRPGYLAAFLQEAFNSPLILQVVEELRSTFPGILGQHQLMNMWGFKYAHNESDWPLNGTEVHADIAAVNVNFWLAPDDANLDEDGGGLIVYTKHAPKEWGFADYNGP
eukprot:TRINITY_DN10746_c0_g1_i2.p1 TRINITY_DN10746_c0_g1~~TRINITY_DN10746_c0_g1_i2.p1  ORF type:complete len:421 (-),score=113.38 TRINITY_DN10746_c0_g1_i2:263-1525(-)